MGYRIEAIEWNKCEQTADSFYKDNKYLTPYSRYSFLSIIKNSANIHRLKESFRYKFRCYELIKENSVIMIIPLMVSEKDKLIRLAGDFNNWDPFMYELQETSRGIYELTLPLPPGTWHYAFFRGTTQIRDESASLKAYTRDGRTASVIVVN